MNTCPSFGWSINLTFMYDMGSLRDSLLLPVSFSRMFFYILQTNKKKKIKSLNYCQHFLYGVLYTHNYYLCLDTQNSYIRKTTKEHSIDVT